MATLGYTGASYRVHIDCRKHVLQHDYDKLQMLLSSIQSIHHQLKSPPPPENQNTIASPCWEPKIWQTDRVSLSSASSLSEWMPKKAFCFVLQTISQKKGSWGLTPSFWAGTYKRWCLVDRSWCTRSRLCIGDVSSQRVGMDFECESGSVRTACNPQIWSYFRVGNDHEVRHSQWWGYMHKIPHCVLVRFLSQKSWWQSSTHKFNKSFSKRNSHEIQREDPLDCWIPKTSIPLPLHDWHSEEAPTDPEGVLQEKP